jgi:hypothetical protein
MKKSVNPDAIFKLSVTPSSSSSESGNLEKVSATTDTTREYSTMTLAH